MNVPTRRLLTRILLALGAAPASCGTGSPASPVVVPAGDAALPTSFGAGDSSAEDGNATEVSTMDGAIPDVFADAETMNADGGPSDAGMDARVIKTIRRPFLVGSSLRQAPSRARGDWRAAEAPDVVIADPGTRAALAESWLDDGLQEHASVAAFARFSMLLLSLGAPADLIEASQRASLDEVRHARACFVLATRYGRAPVGPGPLYVADSLAPMTLPELAALTAEEGCVGETVGVVQGQYQLAGATDPHVVSVLRRLVADEVRHAELAWRFVRWAVSQDVAVLPAVERAIRAAVEASRRTPVRNYGVDSREWAAHGRLTCRQARGASEVAIQQVVLPAFQALVEGARQPHRGGPAWLSRG